MENFQVLFSNLTLRNLKPFNFHYQVALLDIPTTTSQVRKSRDTPTRSTHLAIHNIPTLYCLDPTISAFLGLL